MQRLRFGVTIPQAVPFAVVREDVLFAERLGIDNAWLVDDFEVHGVPELSPSLFFSGSLGGVVRALVSDDSGAIATASDPL